MVDNLKQTEMIKSKYITDTLSPIEIEKEINNDWLNHSDNDFYKNLNYCELNDFERSYKMGWYKAMYNILYQKIETLNHLLNLKS